MFDWLLQNHHLDLLLSVRSPLVEAFLRTQDVHVSTFPRFHVASPPLLPQEPRLRAGRGGDVFRRVRRIPAGLGVV